MRSLIDRLLNAGGSACSLGLLLGGVDLPRNRLVSRQTSDRRAAGARTRSVLRLMAWTWTALVACGDAGLFGDCADTVMAGAASPDGRYVASVVERNCGATTSHGTLVGLRKASEELDIDEQDGVFSSSGRNDIRILWGGELALRIEARSVQGSTFRKETTWRDVRISYE